MMEILSLCPFVSFVYFFSLFVVAPGTRAELWGLTVYRLVKLVILKTMFFFRGGVSGNGVHQERTWVSVPDMWQVEFWLIMSSSWASILFIFKENEAASSLHSLYRSDEET